MRRKADAQAIIGQAIDALTSGIVVPVDAITLPLDDAAEAHRMIEGRATAGAIVLIP
jgi:NADPH2:quinone reductase